MARRDASERKIQAADLESKRKPPAGTKDEQRTHALLHMPHVRMVPLPEPVTVPPMVNGRELASWERERYAEAMRRERRRELALFDGLIG